MMTTFWDMIPCSVVERTNIVGELADSIFWVEGNHTKWNEDTWIKDNMVDDNIW